MLVAVAVEGTEVLPKEVLEVLEVEATVVIIQVILDNREQQIEVEEQEQELSVEAKVELEVQE
jgi:hypothetical protein